MDLCSESFITNFKQIFDTAAPVKNIKIRQTAYKKKISDNTKALLRQRRMTYRIFVNNPTMSNKNNLNMIKKQVKRSILSDTKSEMKLIIDQCGFWDSVKMTNLLKKKNSTPVNMDPNDINDFFIAISTPSCPQQLPKDDDTQFTHALANMTAFNFAKLTINDIRRAWKKTRNPDNPSEDPVGISNRMLNYSMGNGNFIQCIINLFNSCIKNGIFPSAFKLSKIIPIPKVNVPTSPNELRPISIQPAIAKLFEKCMYHQLICYLESFNKLSNHQFGFRPKHSTSHACIKLSDKIYNNFELDRISVVISIDIRKGFDTVNRNILLEKLKGMGINSNLLQTYFTNRQQYVSIKTENKTVNSTCKSPVLGIPQGSSLSGILFDCLINDLPYCIQSSEPILYADDTGLVDSGKVEELDLLVNNIESDLVSLNQWFTTNELQMNPDKVFYAIFCEDKHLSKANEISIHMNGSPLKRVTSLKLLGTIFDRKLQWKEQVTATVKKCNSVLNDLNPLKNLLSASKKLLLVNACVFSILNYCSIITLRNRSNHTQILKVMKRAARFVFRKRYYDSISHDMYANLKWLSPQAKYKYDVGCMSYKIIEENCPRSFVNYLCPEKFSLHKTRANEYYVSNDAKLSKYSFKYNATKEWLEIVNEVSNECPNLMIFKRKLLQFLRNNEQHNNHHDEGICNLSCIESAINPQ